MVMDTLKESTYVYEIGYCKATIKLSPEYAPSSNVSSIKIVPIDLKNHGPLSLAEIQDAVQGAFESAQRSIMTQSTDPQQTRLPAAATPEAATAKVNAKTPIGKVDTTGIGVRMAEVQYFLDEDLDVKDPDVDARIKALSGDELDFILESDETPVPKLAVAIKAEKKRRADAEARSKAVAVTAVEVEASKKGAGK